MNPDRAKVQEQYNKQNECASPLTRLEQGREKPSIGDKVMRRARGSGGRQRENTRSRRGSDRTPQRLTPIHMNMHMPSTCTGWRSCCASLARLPQARRQAGRQGVRMHVSHRGACTMMRMLSRRYRSQWIGHDTIAHSLRQRSSFLQHPTLASPPLSTHLNPT